MKRVLLGWLLLPILLVGCSKDWDRTWSSMSSDASAPSPSDQGASAAVIARRSAPGFAALPDRGELVGYPAASKPSREGAYTWHRADISEAHALRAIADGQLQITTPSGELLQFRYQRHVEHPSGDWTWIGQLEGGAPSDQAILTFGERAVFGSIAQRDQAALRLSMRQGVSWLIETDLGILAQIDNAATRPSKPDYFVPPKLAGATGTAGADASPGTAATGAAAAASAGTTVIDVLLGFTSGFAAGVGGPSAAVTRLNNMVETANVALQNSLLSPRFRLVHAMQVSYADNTSNGTALEQLTGFIAPDTQTTPAPAFAALRAAREQYGADLVSLVRRFSDPENEGCGIAWLIGGGRTPITQEYEFFGYSVVSDGQDGGYYCREETLAHELAHNMGSAHDLETAKGDNGTLEDNEYGRYAYSFGHKTGVSTGNFYTVMAYGESGQTSYRIFSNPRTTFCGSRACGVASQSDNALSLSQTIPVVATFRTSVQPPPTSNRVRNDVDGDGKSDLVWQQPGRLFYWLMNGSRLRRATGFSLSTAYNAIGVGDLTGDGQLDLLFTSAANDLYLWRGSNGRFAVERFSIRYPVGWTLAGVGDVDGDGKSDLVWHKQGQLVYWIMNGTGITRSAVFAVGSTFRVIGVGDLSGDGKLDLVWTNSANELYVWRGNGTGFSIERSAQAYPAGWTLAGVGDVDADGKSDLVWQKSGRLVYWTMNAAVITRTAAFTLPGTYGVIGVGDLSGDGKLDLLLTNAGNDLQLWRGSGNGFVAESLPVDYPAGWSLVSK